jgi:hypothetical protein
MDVLIVAAVLIAVSFPVLRRPRPEDDPKAQARLVLALLVKLLGGLALYWITFKFYKGGDVYLYHPAAVVLSRQFRQGQFMVRLPDGLGLVGGGFIEVLGGLIYAVIGTSKMAGFLVFAWLGFWGLYFFYRAFQIAVSRETAARYAWFVFFLPSLVFWSSSIGKDSWMVLTLGVASYGIARLLTHRRGGFVVGATGLLGTAMVRPHVTLILMVAVVFAYALRPSGLATGHSRMAKIMGLMVLLAGSALLVGRVEQFLNIKNIDQQSVNLVLSQEATNNHSGGSAYANSAPSLARFPQAAVTVLFRPFPWEAHSSQQVAASIEGLFLMVVFAWSLPRLWQVRDRFRGTPYVAMATVYSLLFMHLFSSFSNFGLLARERDQLYPFLFILMALPAPSKRSRFAPRLDSAPRLAVRGRPDLGRAVATGDLRPRPALASALRPRLSRSKIRGAGGRLPP